MRHRLVLAALLAASFVGGCPNSPLQTGGKRTAVSAKASPKASTPAAIEGSGSLTPIAPGSLPGNPASPGPSASPAPTTQAPSLSGVVRAPASLIGNNGGSVISNGGGHYRTLALTQSPYAGATVALLDALRRPILGPDGSAVTAKADALGRFGFTGALPTHNVLLEVSLPDAKGTLRALVPKDGTGPRVVDVELIGTLSTGYILDQYVKSQLDPQATLDKLTGDVERETRLKAATAFEGAQAAVPEAVTDEKVLATVTAMRQKDSAFNDQMEVVKRLLIAAGQSDLGNGRRATEVAISNVSGLALAPNGDLYFPTSFTGRVWRLSPDGILHVFMDGGANRDKYEGDAEIDGRLPAEAYIRIARGISIDAQGRLLISDRPLFGSERVSRLEADGRFKLLKDQPGGETILAGPDGTVFAGDDFERIAGRDAQGRLYIVYWADAIGGKIIRVDPVTQQKETVLTRDTTLTAFYVTPDAAIVTLRDGKLELTEQDGTKKVLLDDEAAVTAAGLNYLSSAVRAADGTLYLASNGRKANVPRNGLWANEKTPRMIWRVKDGKLSILAGRSGAGLVGASADDLALASPLGLTVDSNGNMYIADTVDDAVYKLGPDGKLKAVIEVVAPLLMQADGSGNAYVLRKADYNRVGNFQGHQVLKIAPDGSTTVLAGSTDSLYLYDFEVAADGTLYLLGADTDSERVTLYRQVGTAAPTSLGTVHDLEGPRVDFPMQGLALAADGSLWVGDCGADHVDNGRIWRWTPDAGVSLVKSGVKLAFSHNSGENRGFSADAQGRLMWGEPSQLVRFDPATGVTDVLAGKNGRFFTGTTADDSVGACAQPTFNAAGDLIFVDGFHRQIKRIPKAEL